MTGAVGDPDDLSRADHEAMRAVLVRTEAPDGLPWPSGTSSLARLVAWAAHGLFLADEGVEPPADPRDATMVVQRQEQAGGLSFEKALAVLLGLIGEPLLVEVSVRGWALLGVRATLVGGDDVGAEERRRPASMRATTACGSSSPTGTTGKACGWTDARTSVPRGRRSGRTSSISTWSTACGSRSASIAVHADARTRGSRRCLEADVENVQHRGERHGHPEAGA